MKKILVLTSLLCALSLILFGGNIQADEVSVTSTSKVQANIYGGNGDKNNQRVVIPPNPGLPIDTGAAAPINLRPTRAWNEAPLEKTGMEKKSIFGQKRMWTLDQLRAICEEQPSDKIRIVAPEEGRGNVSSLRLSRTREQKAVKPAYTSKRAKKTELKFESFRYWGFENNSPKPSALGSKPDSVANRTKKVAVVVGQENLKAFQATGFPEPEVVGKATASGYTDPEEILAQITLRFVEEKGADAVILHSWGVDREQASGGDKKAVVPGVNWVTGLLGTVSLGAWSKHREYVKFRSRVWVTALAVNYAEAEPKPKRPVPPAPTAPMPVFPGPFKEKAAEEEISKPFPIEPIRFSVEFPFDKFIISNKEFWKVKGFAAYIAENWEKVNSQGQFVFVGHADERGSHNYNDSLAMRRALMVHTQVAKILESDYGFTRSQTQRIKFVSAGKYHTVFLNARNKEEHQGNRQVYLVVVVPGIQGHNTPY